MSETETQNSEARRTEQLQLIYDYTKFHIVLCLLTSPAIAIIADAFSIQHLFGFQFGLGIMVILHLISGLHAIVWLGQYVNDWKDEDFIDRLENNFYSKTRKPLQLILYWLGLAIGILGLALSLLVKFV